MAKVVDSLFSVCYDEIVKGKRIEVAYFKSSSFDVSGTEEKGQKGNAPKGRASVRAVVLGMHLRGV